MITSNTDHFIKTLDRLLKRYSLTIEDRLKVKRLKKCQILSIASTEDGGFHCLNGKFHADQIPDTFKVRVYYVSEEDSKQRMMVFISNDSTAGLTQFSG